MWDDEEDIEFPESPIPYIFFLTNPSPIPISLQVAYLDILHGKYVSFETCTKLVACFAEQQEFKKHDIVWAYSLKEQAWINDIIRNI